MKLLPRAALFACAALLLARCSQASASDCGVIDWLHRCKAGSYGHGWKELVCAYEQPGSGAEEYKPPLMEVGPTLKPFPEELKQRTPTPPSKPAEVLPPAKTPAVVVPPSATEIEKRLGEWAKANQTDGPSVTGQIVEIKIGDKTIKLEIRVVGGDVVNPIVGPATDFEKAVRDAFQIGDKDKGSDADRETGRKALAGTYRNIAGNITDPTLLKTGTKVFDVLNAGLSGQTKAKALTETQKAVDAYLKNKLPEGDRTKDLTADSRQAYKSAFEDVANALDKAKQ
jgi:hypothetical protein